MSLHRVCWIPLVWYSFDIQSKLPVTFPSLSNQSMNPPSSVCSFWCLSCDIKYGWIYFFSYWSVFAWEAGHHSFLWTYTPIPALASEPPFWDALWGAFTASIVGHLIPLAIAAEPSCLWHFRLSNIAVEILSLSSLTQDLVLGSPPPQHPFWPFWHSLLCP